MEETNINFKIPNEIHTRLKLRAAEQRTTLQKLIIGILEKDVLDQE